MELLGQLAGGVAHDFNNLLTAIVAYGEFARQSLPPDHAARNDLDELLTAADRAASLVGQLLAFARSQPSQKRLVNLNHQLSSLRRTVMRLMGEDLKVTMTLSPELWPVMADPCQIDQIVLNLALNARDAMPDGGTLTIETHNTVLGPEGSATLLHAPPGEYVVLSVTDTGVGMSEEVQARVFEPFFTTKAPGVGSGLGLATVRGIVFQHQGDLALVSQVGVGSTFRVYLPRAQSGSREQQAGMAAAGMPRGDETILLVEDDPSIRRVVSQTLSGLGYRVLTAASGLEALALSSLQDASVDLVVTDMVMPGMSGQTLARHLASRGRHPKVLFISGYAPEWTSEGIAPMLQKPFSPAELAEAVRNVLDGRSGDPADARDRYS
jgi:CheY-like chemotaxis protein